MPVYHGNNKIEKIYKGSTRLWRAYKGSQLVFGYEPNDVLFESSTAGTYTINVIDACRADIILVGGGGGGAHAYAGYGGDSRAYGGCGALVRGNVEISSGTYTIVVGGGGKYGDTTDGGVTAQDGGNSSFNGNIARGGKGGYAYSFLEARHTDGNGGTATVVTAGLTGTNGAKSTTADTYGNYGGGGYSTNNGHTGYVKIIVTEA